MRVPFLLFGLTAALLARENPFMPVGTAPSKAVRTAPSPAASDGRKAEKSSDSVEKRVPGNDRIVNFQNIRLLFSPTRVRIETKDRLLKHFTIEKPSCIILDFESDADFPTRRRDVDVPPFRQIRMGIHDGFYRVVLETNATVPYRIEPFRYGYLLFVD